MKQFKFFFLFLMIFGACTRSRAQLSTLKNDIQQVIKKQRAQIGVAVFDFSEHEKLLLNNDIQYPMQSVYKFHIALYILHLVEIGQLSLEQEVLLSQKDLLPDTWSPLREKYPNPPVKVSLEELLVFMVSKSDNNACDILFRLAGGSERVHNFIQSYTPDVSIKTTEQEMHREWSVQFTNTTKPSATVDLLFLFDQQKILSKQYTELLLKWMIISENSANRIKGKLPNGTIVAHKTGTSARSKKSKMQTMNDVGIIEMPNGRRVAIAVYIANSKESDEDNAEVIAQVAQIVWNHYSSRL